MSHNSSEVAAIKVIRQLTSYFVERPECCQWNKEKQVDKVKSFNDLECFLVTLCSASVSLIQAMH